MEKENKLRTWIVIDSDGERHEVIAHYIGRAVDGSINLFHRGEPNMNMIATFTKPRSVILKEPQKLSGPPENYPIEISAPPSKVEGFRVLAWAEKPRREGNYPSGIVLVHRPGANYQEYIVWEAYTKDGGITWEASAGGYYTTQKTGWKGFTDRCASTNLAEK